MFIRNLNNLGREIEIDYEIFAMKRVQGNFISIILLKLVDYNII